MYYLLTERFKDQEKILTALILKIAAVEQIYMLGSTLYQQRTESIFLTTAPSCHNAGHYYLLVLTGKNSGFSNNDLQDRIENTCRSFIPVTAIVLSTAQFNNWLQQGQRFACTVLKIAVRLHDAGNTILLKPNTMVEATKNKTKESYWTEDYNRVNEFMAGAELYLVRKQNNMALFMLHQAAEQALQHIFKKTTGLHINTHNIDKLIRYCSMVSYQILQVFPKDNERNERLFLLLQKAYIETRYKENYTVSSGDLQIIKERIQYLQKILLESSV
jgi:uncharacterized protein